MFALRPQTAAPPCNPRRHLVVVPDGPSPRKWQGPGATRAQRTGAPLGLGRPLLSFSLFLGIPVEQLVPGKAIEAEVPPVPVTPGTFALDKVPQLDKGNDLPPSR